MILGSFFSSEKSTDLSSNMIHMVRRMKSIDQKTKVLIMTPGILPVPSVRGGAVEKLITDLLDGNEIRNKLDITVVTIADGEIRSDK